MKRLIFTLLAAMLLAAPAVRADRADDAVAAAKAAPKAKARVLAREAGDALMQEGRYQEAMSWYLKADNAGNLGAAEAAYYLYDFDRASELLDKYLEKRTKAEAAKDVDFSNRPEAEPTDWTDYLASRISMGSEMLDRVEKIQIIDSINVPADDFFRYLHLASSAGRLVDEDVVAQVIDDELLESLGLVEITAPAYVTEGGEDLIWTATDADGNAQVFESVRLADGSWDAPQQLFDYASLFGNENGMWLSAPFLMNDGVTLYFAADGEESLGGLDIFISRRDGDKFLQPSNIGMPYNSPFNDYLYAIDEETGTGWWATDRNRIPDMVTIYTFIPQELRINYPVDTPDLTSYARVASIAATHDTSADYSRLRRRIANLGSNTAASSANEEDGLRFEFAFPDGHVARRMSDLRTPMSRAAMKELLEARAEIASVQTELSSLRSAYAKGDHGNSQRILDLERRLDTLRSSLTDLSNHVVTAEE